MAGVDVALTEQTSSSMPFAGTLGVEVLGASPREVAARVAWTPERCTTGGALHGGVVMGLADVCGGMCAFLNLPSGSIGTTTIESKTNFLASIRNGHLNAVAAP